MTSNLNSGAIKHCSGSENHRRLRFGVSLGTEKKQIVAMSLKRKSDAISPPLSSSAPPRRPVVVVDHSQTLANDWQRHAQMRSQLHEKHLAFKAAAPGARRFAASAATVSAVPTPDPDSLLIDSYDKKAFLATSKSVEELGATQFVKQAKREFENKKLKELGVAPKKLKTPLHILQGMRKKQQKREDKLRDMVRTPPVC